MLRQPPGGGRNTSHNSGPFYEENLEGISTERHPLVRKLWIQRKNQVNSETINCSRNLFDRYNKRTMLYHFTSCEAVLKIILSNALRFSLSVNLDDPFERVRHRNYFDWVPNIPEKAPAHKYLGYFNSLVDLTNILCFFDETSDRDEAVDPLTNLKMWSHYGKSHKGCCIVVNKEKAIKRFKKNTEGYISDYGSVQYNTLKNYEHVPMSIFDQDGWKKMMFKRLFHNLFFNKANYYAGENEYRFAVNNENQRFAFEIRPLIERIAIAENAAETDVSSIVALCRIYSLEVGRMVISNDKIEYRVI